MNRHGTTSMSLSMQMMVGGYTSINDRNYGTFQELIIILNLFTPVNDALQEQSEFQANSYLLLLVVVPAIAETSSFCHDTSVREFLSCG
jgi:hypothetical protein